MARIKNSPLVRKLDPNSGYVTRVKDYLGYGLNVPNDYIITPEGKKRYLPNRRRRRELKRDYANRHRSNNRSRGLHIRRNGVVVASRDIQMFEEKRINHKFK